MKKLLILPSAAGVLTGVMAMLVGLMLPATLPAQRGNIVSLLPGQQTHPPSPHRECSYLKSC